MEYFRTPAKTFFKGRCSDRHDHKFLHIKSGRQCMASSVYNIHHWNRKTVSADSAKETVQWNLQCIGCCLRTSDGNSKDRIGSQIRFVVCSVRFSHRRIHCVNIRRIHPFQCLLDRRIDIFNRLGNAFSKISSLVAITKFKCLKFTGRRTGWCRSSSHHAATQINFCLYGRISTGIHNFSSYYLFNLQMIHFVILLSKNSLVVSIR